MSVLRGRCLIEMTVRSQESTVVIFTWLAEVREGKGLSALARGHSWCE